MAGGWCCCNLLGLSLAVVLVAWWLAGSRDLPASYDRPPVTNAGGSVYFDHTNLLMPSSVEEIVDIVQSAYHEERKVKVLGAGHSRSAIAHSSDIYISLYNYRGLTGINRDTREVAVRAGTLLKDLIKELDKNGLALSILPTLGDQTVGGALAVGSHATGVSYGNLATFVTVLSFVSGTGKVVSVNATNDPDLFKAAVVSLGMIGITTDVTFKCELSFNLRENITILPLHHCLQSLPELPNLSDHGKVWLQIQSGVCALFNVWRTEDSESVEQGVQLWDVKNRVSEPLLWLGSMLPSLNPHIFSFLYHTLQIFSPYERVASNSDVFIPPLYVPPNHQLELAVAMEDCVPALKEWERLTRNSALSILFTEIRYVKKDDIFLSHDFERDSCHITILLYNPPPDAMHEYFLSVCESLLSQFSARPHWGKYSCGLGRSQVKRIYPKLEDFARIRSEMDPNNIFVNKPLESMFGFGCDSQNDC